MHAILEKVPLQGHQSRKSKDCACVNTNSMKNAASSERRIGMTSATLFEHSFSVQDHVPSHSNHLRDKKERSSRRQ